MFQRVDVNGAKQTPLYTWLKRTCRSPSGLISRSNSVQWQPIRSDDITWSFEKFLLDHNGVPLKRYVPWRDPGTLESDILSLIQACSAKSKPKIKIPSWSG